MVKSIAIGIIAAAMGAVATLWIIAPVEKIEPKKVMVFRGNLQRDLLLCEGDDTQLSVFKNSLLIECADQRKIVATAHGDSSFTIGNLTLMCDKWCKTAFDLSNFKGIMKAEGIIEIGGGMTIEGNGMTIGSENNMWTIK